jgi:hypothetical protein
VSTADRHLKIMNTAMGGFLGQEGTRGDEEIKPIQLSIIIIKNHMETR